MRNSFLSAFQSPTAGSLKVFWESIVNALDYGIAGISPEGTLITWNTTAEKIFGHTAEEVVGSPMEQVFPPQTFKDLRPVFQQVLSDQAVLYYETTYRREGQRPVRMVLNLLPLHDPSGRTIGAGVIIWEKNRKYEKLTLSQEMNSTLSFFLPGIAEIDKEGRFTFVNETFARMLGFPATDQLLGQAWKTIVAAPDRMRATEMQGCLFHENKAEFDITLQKNDGSTYLARVLLIRRVDAQGRFIGAYAFLRNVAEGQRREESANFNQQEFFDFMDNAAVGIHCVGPDGTILWANKTELGLLGYSKEEYIGRNIADFYADHDVIEDILLRLKKHETLNNQQARMKTKDGRIKYVSTSSNVLWKNGKFVHTRCFTRDITEQVVAQKSLNKLMERMELEKTKLEQVLSLEEGLSTIHLMDKLIDFVVEKTAEVLEADKCSFMLLDPKSGILCIKGHKGLDEETVSKSRVRVGEPIAGWVAEKGTPLLVRDIEKDERILRVSRPSYRGKSFLLAPIILHANTLGVLCVADKRSEDGGTFNEIDLKILSTIVRQVAVAIENARLYKQLKYLTLKDPLTNIFNYRYFINSLDHEINRARRYNGSFSLLMLDVDDFKLFNDTFGHQAGDHLLKEIGKILMANLRDADIACRYAGDEFAVILPQTEKEEAQKVAEKIQFFVENLSLQRTVTISIGAAKFTDKMDRYDLILKADKALYQAKHEGKNTVVLC